jgi:hypothetical protein
MVDAAFKCFSCSNDGINASLSWLNNVTGIYLVQVYLLLIGQQGLEIFLCIGPCFPLAGELCKFYANAGGKRPIQRPPPLVISGSLLWRSSNDVHVCIQNYTR